MTELRRRRTLSLLGGGYLVLAAWAAAHPPTFTAVLANFGPANDHHHRRRPGGILMTTPVTHGLAELAHRYGEAWNAHDLDAVMAMHTDDTVFRLHLLDAPGISGRAAVRDGFAGLLALWPDLRFDTERLVVGEDFFVHQYVLNGTLAAPLPLGAAVAHPTGRAARFPGADAVTVSGGRVQRKETYLDTAGAAAQLGLLDAAGAER